MSGMQPPARDGSRSARPLGPDRCLRLLAGIGHWGMVHDLPPEQWAETMRINVDGTFHTVRAVLPAMLVQGSGHIVTVSSVYGRKGSPGFAAYCASKYAVIGFSESLALEVRPQGIKVTVIEPGTVDTGFRDGMANRPRTGLLAHPDKMLTPDDVASAIVWALFDLPDCCTRRDPPRHRPLVTPPGPCPMLPHSGVDGSRGDRPCCSSEYAAPEHGPGSLMRAVDEAANHENSAVHRAIRCQTAKNRSTPHVPHRAVRTSPFPLPQRGEGGAGGVRGLFRSLAGLGRRELGLREASLVLMLSYFASAVLGAVRAVPPQPPVRRGRDGRGLLCRRPHARDLVHARGGRRPLLRLYPRPHRHPPDRRR